MDHPPVALLVDDDPDTRMIFGRVLSHDGYRILEAGTGQEALETARAARPDLVVLDLGLPDVDGLEITRELRADSRTSDSTIVVLTAYVSRADEAHALAAGCDVYVGKPVLPRELLAIIKHLPPRHGLSTPGPLRPPDSEAHLSPPGHPAPA
jgi:DNA-binding response OmpR family regulator